MERGGGELIRGEGGSMCDEEGWGWVDKGLETTTEGWERVGTGRSGEQRVAE